LLLAGSEARGKFLAAARAPRASIEAYVNPNAKGAAGEELALNVARFGDSDAESLLIVCSGTHGNEGFCGSFCQTAFIEEGVIDTRRPRAVVVLLVHAVNPYGFSHIGLVTENNVDFNRNFRDLRGWRLSAGGDPARSTACRSGSRRGRSAGDRRPASRAAIPHEAEAREAEQHHGPG
jgi:hypothetical protein